MLWKGPECWQEVDKGHVLKMCEGLPPPCKKLKCHPISEALVLLYQEWVSEATFYFKNSDSTIQRTTNEMRARNRNGRVSDVFTFVSYWPGHDWCCLPASLTFNNRRPSCWRHGKVRERFDGLENSSGNGERIGDRNKKNNNNILFHFISFYFGNACLCCSGINLLT